MNDQTNDKIPDQPEDNTPDLVKQMSAHMAKMAGSASPTMFQDNLKVQRIYADFKWQLKIALRTWDEVDGLLAQAVHRCEQEIQTPEVRTKAMTAFTNMRNKASEFNVEHPDVHPANAVCPKCQLSVFICPCQKEEA